MKCKTMLRANALFMVIVVSLIIGVVSGAAVLLAFHYRVYAQQYAILQRLERNCSSGVNFILADQTLFADNHDHVIDLFDLGNDSVSMRKINWGVYDIGISKAFHRGSYSSSVFQLGSKPAGLTNAAIYLVNDGNSLAVSGQTIITGDCYLPERGVKGTQIGGYNFSGNNFVQGAVFKSLSHLPDINRLPIDRVAKLLESPYPSLQDSYTDSYDILADSITHSFQSMPLLIYKPGPLIIEKSYIGNILFKSDTLVVVRAHARLEDVIIVAPDIIIEENFKGNLQAFATDTLGIGQNSELRYPSVLGIIKSNYKINQPALMISKNTQVNGFIFSYQRVADTRMTLISLQPGSKIYGHIFSDGYVELKGAVTGGIMCNKFLLRTPSSVYENHLLNIAIDRVHLSEHYLLPPILEVMKQKEVVKWLP